MSQPSHSGPKRVYLAGPFFNDAQVRLVESIEQALDDSGLPYFSPRKMSLNGNSTTTKPNKEQAGAIFRKDYEEICRSTHLLAVMDWTMNPRTSLRVVSEHEVWENQENPNWYRALSGHLAFPDSGTVWEMGCAYALRVPVYLFTANPSARLNLMLSQSARGVIYGLEKLAPFLASGMDESLLEEWKGEHR